MSCIGRHSSLIVCGLFFQGLRLSVFWFSRPKNRRWHISPWLILKRKTINEWWKETRRHLRWPKTNSSSSRPFFQLRCSIHGCSGRGYRNTETEHVHSGYQTIGKEITSQERDFSSTRKNCKFNIPVIATRPNWPLSSLLQLVFSCQIVLQYFYTDFIGNIFLGTKKNIFPYVLSSLRSLDKMSGQGEQTYRRKLFVIFVCFCRVHY